EKETPIRTTASHPICPKDRGDDPRNEPKFVPQWKKIAALYDSRQKLTTARTTSDRDLTTDNRELLLKRRRSVYPEYPCFRTPRILPAMRSCAFEIETVSRL